MGKQAQRAVVAKGAGRIIAGAQGVVFVPVLTGNEAGGLLIEIGCGEGGGAEMAMVQVAPVKKIQLALVIT